MIFFKNIKLLFLISTIVIVYMLLSCGYSDSFEENGQDESTKPVPPKPIKEIIWETDTNGDTQFYINNPAVIDIVNGNTGWTYGGICETTMDTIEVEACRVSGIRRGYGFGVVFCVQSVPVPDDVSYNFLAVLINIDQEYCVIRCMYNDTDDELDYEYILGVDDNNWLTHPNLTTGYSTFNKIAVKYNGMDDGKDEFSLTFNDVTDDVIDFEYDHSEAFEIVGRYGYIVTLAPDEDFPEHPADFRFREIIPSGILEP